jgi:mitogen-activated protein kinase kinase kinase
MGNASSKWLKNLDLTKPIDIGFTERVFAEFDTDHNGVLDKDEALVFVRKWCTFHGMGDSHGARFQEFWNQFAVGGVITKDVLMGTREHTRGEHRSTGSSIMSPSQQRGSLSMPSSHGAYVTKTYAIEDNKHISKAAAVSSPPSVNLPSASTTLQTPVIVPQPTSWTAGYSPNFQEPPMYQNAVPQIMLYIKTLATRAEAATQASVIYTSQSPLTPVKDLMQLIVDVFKVPLDHQTLICEGDLLEPDKTLEYYKLQNDDVIVLADQIPFVKEVTSVGQVKQHLDNGGSLGGDREAGCLVWSDRKKEHYHIFWETATKVWCAKAQPPLTFQEREAARVRSSAPAKQFSLLLSSGSLTGVERDRARPTIYQPKEAHDVYSPQLQSPNPSQSGLSSMSSPPPSLTRPPSFTTSPDKSLQMSPAPRVQQEGIHWRRGVEIGSGSFGKVYQAQNVKTGELMAVKQVKIKMDSEERKAQVKQLEREIAAMALLTHPNIVQMICTEIKQDKINILMEYVPGASLAAQLKQFGPFQEPHARKYTKQLLEALAYCHAEGIVHRDIKGGNILVSLQGSPKLADFGSAKRFADVNADSHLSVGYCYTTDWTAPEVFAHGAYNSKVDIWSVGCVVIEMMTGKLPWAEQKFASRERAMFFIGSTTEIPQIPQKLSPQGQDFLLRCLQRDPVKRASAVELLEHAWIKAA